MSETWHGIVHSVEASGIYVTIPRLMGKEVLGPALTAVPNLAAGDRVVGAKIGDLLSDLIILTRATGPDYATEAFVNAAGTPDATPNTLMRRDGTGSSMVEDLFLNSSATEPNRAVAKSELDAGLATKAPVAHRHPWSDLDNVPASFTPSAHTHDWTTGITGKPATFAPSAHTHDWTSGITGKPATFAPSAHTHPWTDVTGKPATFAPSAHRHPWADLDNVPATFAPSAHVHPSTDISDSTSIGRSLLIAQTAAGARTTIGAMDAARTFTKADVGLGSVDNTADIDKPVSNPVQTALNLKADDTDIKAFAIAAKLATAAPSTYPDGHSFFAVGADTTWPGALGGYGTVSTVRAGASRTMQTFMVKGTGEHYWRSEADGDVWDDWQLSGTGPWVTLTTSGAWVPYVGGGNYYQGLRARRNGKNVQIQGMVKSGAVGTIAALPADLTPLYTTLQTAVCGNATTTRTTCYIVVSGRGGQSGTGSGAITYDSGISAPTFVSLDFELPLNDA